MKAIKISFHATVKYFSNIEKAIAWLKNFASDGKITDCTLESSYDILPDRCRVYVLRSINENEKELYSRFGFETEDEYIEVEIEPITIK